MSKPKYLPIPKKVPYNIRLPKHLQDKLNAYADLSGNTTTDIVIGALNDFIKDKTVFNDYLPNIKGISIRLPMLSDEKTDFYNTNLIGDNSAAELYHETAGYSATTEAYEILKIPNNLDIFSESFGYYSMFNRIGMKGNHSGIEFVVIPDFYTYSYDNGDDILGVLYCLYFEVETNELKSIKIIDYMDAINKANDVGNVDLKNTIISCVNELKELEMNIADGEYFDADKLVDDVYSALEKIAAKYNSGNVIPLGENVDAAVVTAKVNTHPELYDEFMDDVKDNTERYVDVVIAERFHNIMNNRLSEIERNIRNAKSKDEILTAIGDAKIITKK